MNAESSTRKATGHTSHFIDGKWSAPGERTFVDRNPFDGDDFAQVAAGGRIEAEAAVAAAAAAFPAWSAMPPRERQQLFLRAADVVDQRSVRIVRELALESGA